MEKSATENHCLTRRLKKKLRKCKVWWKIKTGGRQDETADTYVVVYDILL